MRRDIAVCMLCEAICGIEVEHDGARVASVRGDAKDRFSRGHICPKGVALADLHNDPDRLRRPLRRDGDRWEEIGWDEALGLAARRIVEIQNRHGRSAVGLYVGNPTGASYTAMLYGQLLAGALRTRNRFSSMSVDALPRQLASLELYGNQAMIPIPDLDRTEHLLMLGANPAVSNGSVMTAPGVIRRLRDLRARGGWLVVIDPRRTETAELADAHHFIRPGTDALFLAAFLHVLFVEGLVDEAKLGSRYTGLAEVRRLVSSFPPERVAPRVGIDAGVIAALAREFAAARTAVCYGRMGTCVQEFGTIASWLIDLVNIVTGNLDRPGGAMFTTPAFDLAGLARRLGAAGSYGRWHSRVSHLPEYTGELPVAAFAEEIETPGPGQIRGLVTHAGNPLLSLPNGRRLTRAFESLEFIVSIDIYRNETTRLAHLILPPTFGLEREHYPLIAHAVAVRNTAHYARAVLDKPAGSLHDWEILAGLAEHIGRERGGFEGMKSRLAGALGRVFGPKRLLSLFLRFGPHRISLAHLEREPHGIDLGALEPRLDELTRGKPIYVVPPRFRDDFVRLERRLGEATSASDERLLLVSRRSLRSNNSWMHNSERLVRGRPSCVLLMNPKDGERRGMVSGQEVVLKSRVGGICVPLELTTEVMPGVVSLPHGWGHDRSGSRLGVASAYAGASVNDVTDDALVDALSGTTSLGVPVPVTPVGT